MAGRWESLEKLLNEEKELKGALAGISIRSRDSGKLLFHNLGDTRLHPASNMKIFTSSVGLAVLGEEYRFSTELWIDGIIEENILHGNLYLKGKGDPTLLQSDIDRLAKVIKNEGINIINGNVVGDDTWYDNVRLSQDLNWNDEHYYYGSQVSALTVSPNEDYDSGTIMLTITPGKKLGEKATIALTPTTNYINITNKIRTVESNSIEDDTNIVVIREHGNNNVIVEGTIPLSSPVVHEWVAVWEPTEFVLELFGRSLKQYDVQYKGRILTGKTPENAKQLFIRDSIPLKDLCIPFMKLSNNGHGEIIVKELGRVVNGEGSWEEGLLVLEETLQKLGVDISKTVIRDGSGISHVTLIPPNEITKFLFRIQKEKWFDSFYRSLPVGGELDRMIGGTLNDRLDGLEVYAKTGTIKGVSTLSGYFKTEEGEDLIFSIMLNNLLDEEDGAKIIDKIVRFICSAKNKTIVS
ncbi:D-alanyl-D-alanine carboxypeptidase/D-alanyl-D-alanine endopeptidase [Ornithinibacillus halotolerans]|uniref:D-alanyl-D-alanine carboxypeptidase DacC n=1 Tax=Ornithinibacillus halotolerans TaxID=1274357 RepID=A0A916S9K9_9BACI|nr:D-alanyl-D-alanine carboxypeptidase/D-alanyl-D-alanine-endopeptidase [Ornithinibacillus halotolerans]GGA87395.1 D-alanyl-D-alanine carboxypeptidase DacC [Ornithinibacillus halotolerans]